MSVINLRVPLCGVFTLFAVASTTDVRGQGSSSYVVLQVTDHEGKLSHKPLADKEQAACRKTVEDAFQKARRAYEEEKKAFQKENPGAKFEKPEPKKPRVTVAKRSLKTFNDARKAAFDLDKQAAEKAKNGNGKNEKNGKNGNGKNGKSAKEGSDKGKGAE